MFKLTYIIADRNSEPAPPEFMYYCGASNLEWNESPDEALKFNSLDNLLEVYLGLSYNTSLNLMAFQITQSLIPLNSDVFGELLVKAKAAKILTKFSRNEIAFLEDNNLLDLSSIT